MDRWGVPCPHVSGIDRDPHHSLVADFPRECCVVHPRDMQVGVSAVDPCIVWGSAIAKSFFEAADLRPPTQRLRSVGGRQNRNSAFDDRFHRWSIKRIQLDYRSQSLLKSRQDFSLIRFQRAFFLAAHQIDIELGYSNAR